MKCLIEYDGGDTNAKTVFCTYNWDKYHDLK